MYTAIFFLGLAGSLHCVGMCGPLTLIAPVNRLHRINMLADMTLYHAARVGVYALMGAIIGTAGQLFAISKVQSNLALVFGILLVLWGLSYYLPLGRQKFLDAFGMDRWFVKIYNRYLQHNSRKNVAILGALNGVLPCGLVYSAMAMAFLGGNLGTGALQMILFGLGTMPLLYAFQMGLANRSVFSFLKQRGLSPLLFVLSGAFVVYKAISIMVPKEASLLNAVADPIMCH
ncbi:MAG: sulfite exporter TauE/SafE family protein [Saprospiraceae bacterium]|nr:sulfite exporter TauE/SafE family protein [Saprospiraceae bacterium]MBK8852034.1 sulfite exporter TauE/SafE family protein [Saprospiraceae bacterium]MBK9686695.1 sulfite exporter TauE/SafE family protein [Saprospiraceae bacterium]MBL0082337.1 sulfite exporter TauE/SafE family protein [Saprospiraceae bacterium]